ncbi:MAG TPA: hypothetical protein VKN35_14315, partial [Xanthomonadales bacterium]|nr:hypothetical protein [Xanthomonadales bacterium]
MKSKILTLVLLVCSFNLHGYENFIQNPDTPYPPGCVYEEDPEALLESERAVRFYTGKLWLSNVNWLSKGVEANLSLYRVACSEPNRSVIILELASSGGMAPGHYYNVPYGWLWNNNDAADLRLGAAP